MMLREGGPALWPDLLTVSRVNNSSQAQALHSYFRAAEKILHDTSAATADVAETACWGLSWACCHILAHPMSGSVPISQAGAVVTALAGAVRAAVAAAASRWG